MHTHKQRAQLKLGIRPRHILKVKRHAAYHRNNNNNRPHNAYQRNSGTFHGQKFEPLAHISERNKRRQQYSQRHGLGHERKGHISEELREDIHRKPFSYKLVDVSPRKLHHKNEQADEKRSRQHRQEVPRYEQIQFLYRSHPFCTGPITSNWQNYYKLSLSLRFFAGN